MEAVQTKISQQLLDGLPKHFLQTLMVPRRMNPSDVGDLLAFPLAPP